jgi:hypothetical protein
MRDIVDACRIRVVDSKKPESVYRTRYEQAIERSRLPAIVFTQADGGVLYVADKTLLPPNESALAREIQFFAEAAWALRSRHRRCARGRAHGTGPIGVGASSNRDGGPLSSSCCRGIVLLLCATTATTTTTSTSTATTSTSTTTITTTTTSTPSIGMESIKKFASNINVDKYHEKIYPQTTFSGKNGGVTNLQNVKPKTNAFNHNHTLTTKKIYKEGTTVSVKSQQDQNNHTNKDERVSIKNKPTIIYSDIKNIKEKYKSFLKGNDT